MKASIHAHGASETKARPSVTSAAAVQRKRLGERLRALRERAGLTQEAGAEAIGLHVKHLQRVEAGNANVTLVTMVACALAYGVTVAALFQPEASAREPFRRGARGIPLLSLRAAAGRFGSMQQVEPEAWVGVPGVRAHPDLFVTRVLGESMNRRIPSGSFALFRAPPRPPLDGKIVLVQHRRIEDPDHGGQYTVKLLDLSRGARLLPLSTSRRYRPMVLRGSERDELSIIAELVKVLR